MAAPLLVAKNDKTTLALLPSLANRHGLITGATGTGKTVTLQALAHGFSAIGVPVFMADVKGDLSGIAKAGGSNSKVAERFKQLKVKPVYEGCPVEFWDVYGQAGIPVRATVTDMGPLLLSRLLALNDIQEGVLGLVFKVAADDRGRKLEDLHQLRDLLRQVSEKAGTLRAEYGNVTSSSIGAIQRGLLSLEVQGAEQFFGEPMLDIHDLMAVRDGKGVVNVLVADKLLNAPKVYATFLMWVLSELFENLPEVGDAEKPKLVFFFDEAHLLFKDAPRALVDKVEQVVRLIRSKGVGVYFVTQSPLDVPESILGQLGNRVQHALRAFTPRDQKAVTAAAETFRANPKLKVDKVITELAVGEALISMLDEKGQPLVVERAFVVPPGSQIGPITPAERERIFQSSSLYSEYHRAATREPHVEPRSQDRAQQGNDKNSHTPGALEKGASVARDLYQEAKPFITSLVRSIGSSIGREIGHQIIRGALGSISRVGGGENPKEGLPVQRRTPKPRKG